MFKLRRQVHRTHLRKEAAKGPCEVIQTHEIEGKIISKQNLNEKVSLINTKDRGRAIAANRDHPMGTCLLKEVPVAAVVSNTHIKTTCSCCFTEKHSLRCSACRTVFYCSRQCQRSDWPLHQLECQLFQQTSGKTLPTFQRLFIRLVILVARDEEAFGKIESLVSHRDKFPTTTLESFAQMSMILSHLPLSPLPLNASQLIELLCKISTNAITICDEEYVNKGLALYPQLSMINHSCTPNASLCFSGTTAKVRLLRPVSADEEITISYVEDMPSRSIRRQRLQDGYYFTCDCLICESTVDRWLAWKCPNCPGEFYLDDKDVGSETKEQFTSCHLCNQVIPMDILQTINSLQNKSVKLLEKDSDSSQHAAEIDDLDAKLTRYAQAPNSLAYLVAKTRQDRLLHLTEQPWLLIQEVTMRVAQHLEVTHGPHHPLLSVQYMMLAKIHETLDQDLDIIKESTTTALNHLKVTHGEDALLYKQMSEKMHALAAVNSMRTLDIKGQ